jgi:PPM family protein phosphatase
MAEPVFEIEIGAVTDPGRKRRDEPNQDVIQVIPPNFQTGSSALFIIADGMGGYKGGALASRLVVDTIVERYKAGPPDYDLPALLTEGILQAHSKVRTRASQDSSLLKMGSTVVLVVPTVEKVICANVGDSRAYLLNGRQIRQISMDQTVVADQVRAGLLTPLQALHDPKRNRLTQSINANRAVVRPYINQVEWAKEDVLLLCSDGLWAVVSDAILRAVAWELPPQTAAEKLVELSKASGAPDNVSVIIARRKGWTPVKLLEDDITNPGE